MALLGSCAAVELNFIPTSTSQLKPELLGGSLASRAGSLKLLSNACRVREGHQGCKPSSLPVSCMAKGFGAAPKTKSPSTGVAAPRQPFLKEQASAASGAEDADPCPCGGTPERRSYKACCGRYHGGVKEPDVQTLLKARYSAFARGILPYLVRTTHPENPNLEGGSEQLLADCKETCQRLLFKRLDIGAVEEGDGENEAFVSFQVVYAFKHGTTTENQLLVEKSRFVKDGGRWYYREKVPTDAVSDALWRHGGMLAEETESKIALTKGIFGRAQPKLRPRSR